MTHYIDHSPLKVHLEPLAMRPYLSLKLTLGLKCQVRQAWLMCLEIVMLI